MVGSAVVQLAHNGALRVPARSGARVPQLEHVAQECEQLAHHGRPVMVEIRHGRVRSQTLQIEIVLGTHVGQSGPSALRWETFRRRPQPTHSSRLIGSSIKQFGHSGRPWLSRVAGSRTVPQREQATARARA